MIEISVLETKRSTSNECWLLDSCAGAHIIGDGSFFRENTMKPISDVFISFADGKKIRATHSFYC